MTRMLILEGWNSYRREVIPAGASDEHIEECKRAFYAGSMMLYQSIMTVLSPGNAITEKDIAQMQAISDEIKRYIEESIRKHLKM